jgi:hypothetical protein
MILKKILIGLCGALLIVGLSFGEASAVRLDFTGYLSTNITVPITGFFEYTTPGSGVTTNGVAGAFTTYSGITGSYGIAWDGVSLTGTTIDARVYNDYTSSSSSPTSDTFRIATDTTPTDFSGVRFQMEFKNKIGTGASLITLIDLVTSLSLPDSLNLSGFPFAYDSQNSGREYTEIVGGYYNASNSRTAAFTFTSIRFGSAEPTPVPEPATMFLLGSGLIGVGVFVRRRFKK